MLALALFFACSSAPIPPASPPVSLPAPWTASSSAVGAGEVVKATETSLVLKYAPPASLQELSGRHAAALTEAGWTVDPPMGAGSVVLRSCRKGDQELVLAAVPKKGGAIEIHLDL